MNVKTTIAVARNKFNKCKLIKGKHPLKQFKFYLDITSSQISTKIEQLIKELGGNLEFFWTQEVTHFITDKDINESNTASASTPTTTNYGNQSVNSNYSDCSINSPTVSNDIKAPKPRTQSRANAMLHKARRETNDISATQQDRIIRKARELDTVIWHTNYTFKFLKKLLADVVLNNNNNNSSSNNANLNSPSQDIIKLKDNYIKVESVDRSYRPFYRILKKSDFTILKIRNKQKEKQQQHKEDEEENKKMTRKSRSSSKPRAQNNHQVNIKSSSKVVSSTDKQCGYCELCKVEYDVLKIHLKTEEHTCFVKNNQNYMVLDTLIKNGANVKSFLNEHATKIERDLSEQYSPTKQENKITTTSPLKSPRNLRQTATRLCKTAIQRSTVAAEDALQLCVSPAIEKTKNTKPIVKDSPPIRHTLQNNLLYKVVDDENNGTNGKKNSGDCKKDGGGGGNMAEQQAVPIIVKFKKIRQSELTLLNGEAVNFMFPPKRRSSTDFTDIDRQTTSENSRLSTSSSLTSDENNDSSSYSAATTTTATTATTTASSTTTTTHAKRRKPNDTNTNKASSCNKTTDANLEDSSLIGKRTVGGGGGSTVAASTATVTTTMMTRAQSPPILRKLRTSGAGAATPSAAAAVANNTSPTPATNHMRTRRQRVTTTYKEIDDDEILLMEELLMMDDEDEPPPQTRRRYRRRTVPNAAGGRATMSTRYGRRSTAATTTTTKVSSTTSTSRGTRGKVEATIKYKSCSEEEEDDVVVVVDGGEKVEAVEVEQVVVKEEPSLDVLPPLLETSERLQNSVYSFERVPSADQWYRTFQRQDNCQQRFFEYYGSTDYRKLPYEMGAQKIEEYHNSCLLCPKKPDTKTEEKAEEEILSAEVRIKQEEPPPPSSLGEEEEEEDDAEEEEEEEEEEIETKPNSELKTSRRSKTIFKKAWLFETPRKSPRVHASTLAILSCLLRQKEKEMAESGGDRSPTPSPSKSTSSRISSPCKKEVLPIKEEQPAVPATAEEPSKNIPSSRRESIRCRDQSVGGASCGGRGAGSSSDTPPPPPPTVAATQQPPSKKKSSRAELLTPSPNEDQQSDYVSVFQREKEISDFLSNEFTSSFTCDNPLDDIVDKSTNHQQQVVSPTTTTNTNTATPTATTTTTTTTTTTSSSVDKDFDFCKFSSSQYSLVDLVTDSDNINFSQFYFNKKLTYSSRYNGGKRGQYNGMIGGGGGLFTTNIGKKRKNNKTGWPNKKRQPSMNNQRRCKIFTFNNRIKKNDAAATVAFCATATAADDANSVCTESTECTFDSIEKIEEPTPPASCGTPIEPMEVDTEDNFNVSSDETTLDEQPKDEIVDNENLVVVVGGGGCSATAVSSSCSNLSLDHMIKKQQQPIVRLRRFKR